MPRKVKMVSQSLAASNRDIGRVVKTVLTKALTGYSAQRFNNGITVNVSFDLQNNGKLFANAKTQDGANFGTWEVKISAV